MSGRIRRVIHVSLVICLILGVNGETEAWCVKRTTGKIVCLSGYQQTCCLGTMYTWANDNMTYTISASTDSMLYDDIHAGFQTWNDVEMSTFTFTDGGTSSEYRQQYDNTNLVSIDSDFCVHYPDYCPGGSLITLGFSGCWNSGAAITECDIILNGDEVVWGDGSGGTEDTIAVIVHEAGHDVGITHPGSTCRSSGSAGCGAEFEEATMYWKYSDGQPTNKQSLELDDMAALVYGYPRSTFRVRVLQHGNPMSGASVELIGTSAPVDGASIAEGGMVQGDLASAYLFGDQASSSTYVSSTPFTLTDASGYTNYIHPIHQSFSVQATKGDDTATQVVTVADGVSEILVNLPASCLETGLYQETSAEIAYSGTWTQTSASGASEGAVTYTNDATATASFCFTGTELMLVYTGYSNRGEMQVCVDGNCEIVNQYRSTLSWQESYTISDLSAGEHTVTLSRISGYIDLDAIRVADRSPSCASPLTTGLYQESATELTFSGAWVFANGSGANGGALAYTNDASAEVSFCFTETAITLLYTGYPNRGEMQVCVDDNCEVVNQYRTTLSWQDSYSLSGLLDGEHRVTISRLSGYIDLDAIVMPVCCSVPLSAGLYQETETNLTYSGAWTPYSNSNANGGSLTYTNTPDAAVDFTFEGSGVTIYRTLYSNRGSMEVCVDGTCETVANYSASVQWNQPCTIDGLTSGTHNVTISNTSANYIDLDAVEILNDTVLPAGLYQETDGRIAYTGTWTSYSHSSTNGGTLTYSNDPAATVSFSFQGTDLILYRTLYANRGDMDVCVDGSCQTVSNYSAAVQWNQPYSISGLSAGEHAVVVSNASAAYIDLDAVEVQEAASLQSEAVTTESSITIRKAGTGNGTLIAETSSCGPECDTFSIPYIEAERVTVQVLPDDASLFIGWQTLEGTPLEEIFYAQPGDTVLAVFERQ